MTADTRTITVEHLEAELEGFAWIGMEREPEYLAIAEARLNGTQRGFSW